MVMVMNLWTKRLPTTPETHLVDVLSYKATEEMRISATSNNIGMNHLNFKGLYDKEHVSFVQPRIHSSLKSSRNL
jgi:hypothetical protein